MIEVRRGELHAAHAEALLRPLSAEGDPVTTAGRQLGEVAGPTVEARLRELGEIPVGGAVITPAGNLSASFVIHVVVQSAAEPMTGPTVERALVNGLRRATEWGVTSLALPPVGIGPGNMEPEAAARILFDVLVEHREGAADPIDFTIVVESDFEEELYRRLVAPAEPA